MEGYIPLELDHLFKSIVLSKFTYALPVYEVSLSDLNLVQRFLTRCYKRRYTMEKLDIFDILEQCDRRLHAKIVHNSVHLLQPLILQNVTYTILGKTWDNEKKEKCFNHAPRWDFEKDYETVGLVMLKEQLQHAEAEITSLNEQTRLLKENFQKLEEQIERLCKENEVLKSRRFVILLMASST